MTAPRAAVAQHVAQIVGGGGGVGRHRDRARGHDREVGDRPFRAVLGDQHHAVAGRHAVRASALASAAAPRRPAPAGRPLGAVALGPQERPVAAPAGALEEHRRQVPDCGRSRPPVAACRPVLPPRQPSVGSGRRATYIGSPPKEKTMPDRAAPRRPPRRLGLAWARCRMGPDRPLSRHGRPPSSRPTCKPRGPRRRRSPSATAASSRRSTAPGSPSRSGPTRRSTSGCRGS